MASFLTLFSFFIIFYIETNTAFFINVENNACNDLNNYPVRYVSENCYRNPDVGADTPTIIQRWGYKVESHFVTTSDGYILQIFRIPPKEDDNRRNKQPVFLLHGILSDSSAWVFIGNRSIGLSLAAEGYDVWIGNERGTRYSRQHQYLKDSDKKYWNYSLDTLAANDVPSFLKTVANITGKAGSIIYIGHSRGMTLLFMYASETPEEAQKLLRGLVALAPTPYYDPPPNARVTFVVGQPLGHIMDLLGIGALFQYPDPVIALAQSLCPFFPHACLQILKQLFGPTDLFPSAELLNFFSHFPAPLSDKELIQRSQHYESNQFQKFDYGTKTNLQVYHQEKPPLYDLGNIKLPTFLYFGSKDYLISEKSINRVFNELGSEKKAVYKVPIGDENGEDQFAHADYLFADNLKELFFLDMLDVMENELQ